MAIPKKVVANRRKREATKPANEVPEGYKRDPKTGKLYRTIPKLDIGADGRSEVVVEGLADLRGDPRDTAEEFLGHLRVAPNPEELAELRALKLEQARKQRAARAEATGKNGGDDDS